MVVATGTAHFCTGRVNGVECSIGCGVCRGCCMNVSAIRRNTKEYTEIVTSKCRDSENMDVDTKIKPQMTKVKIGSMQWPQVVAIFGLCNWVC